MTELEKAHELHSKGFNCAQVVASLCRDLIGVDEEMALAAMGGFGGGMRNGEVCGAVSGAVFTLGLYCPYTDSSDFKAKANVAELTKSFTAAFKDEFDTLICRELIGGGKPHSCEEFMAKASELIHEMIGRDKQNGNL